MSGEEHVRTAMEGREPDRIPTSVWTYISDKDQDPHSLAEAVVKFNETYDYDFIRMIPFGAYAASDWGAKPDIYCDKYREMEIAVPGIECRKDYKRTQPLPAVYGTWGKVLQLSQWLERLVKPGTPYIQTIFSPATTLKGPAGNRTLQGMLECPELVHGALAATTETTIDFMKANIEAGASGFFFVKQCASYDFMGNAMFAEFCKPYDIQIIDAYKDVTWFNVVHTHGSNVRFDEVSAYPCNVTNWHNRQSGPPLKEVREKCPKAFLGRLYERPAIVDSSLEYSSITSRQGTTPGMIKKHTREAVDMVDGKGLLIGPGCVADPRSPEKNLRAVCEAVERSWSQHLENIDTCNLGFKQGTESHEGINS